MPVPPPSKTPSLAVLAAILVLGRRGGRASGPFGVGSGANEGGSSGSVTRGVPDGATVETGADSLGADSPSKPGSEMSSGTSVTVIDATDADTGSVAATDGSLPACSLPAPVQPPDAGFVVVAAGRTVLWCGVGNVNNTECLTASTTECTAVSAYDYAPCYQQCSPCTVLCAPNECAIGVGIPQSLEGPSVPFPSSSVPSNCGAYYPAGCGQRRGLD